MVKSWFLKLSKGKLYEDKAVDYLMKNGYKLISRNYSCKFGEIDAILFKNKEIIIVEIKGGKEFPPPFFRINKNKLKKIILTFELYINENPKISYETVRFDVVSVTSSGSSSDFEFTHFKNVLSDL